MGEFFRDFIVSRIQKFFAEWFSKIRDINVKYANPVLKTGRGARVALLCLRIYLIVLVGILFYKFFTTLGK
jgi:hypothetical protein